MIRIAFGVPLACRCGRILTASIHQFSTAAAATSEGTSTKSADEIFAQGMALLKSNNLDRFREEIPSMAKYAKIQRTKDNYFWILIEEYYKRDIKMSDVEGMFSLYLSLFSARLDDSGSVVFDENKTEGERSNYGGIMATNRRIIFSQKTTFNLLNAAYNDYVRSASTSTESLESLKYPRKSKTANARPNDDDDDSIFVQGAPQQRRPHIYEIILNAVQQYETPRKRRLLHGAILLSRGKAMEFFDEYKMNVLSISFEDVDYFCKLSQNVKEPAILRPLIDMESLLPRNDKLIAEIYETLALLYGQRQDVEKLKQITDRLLATKRRLSVYRHALHRIRHFYRCANVVAPPELLQVIARIDPSMRA